MFFHQYKYRIKYFTKQKMSIFWILLFPILLGSLFRFTFGSDISKFEQFSTVSVAVVGEARTPSNERFLQVLKSVSYEKGEKIFLVNETDKKEAETLLEQDKVDVIITMDEQRTMSVKKSGIAQSITKSFMDQYARTEVANHTITSKDFVEKITVNGSKTSFLIQYYYALIAMTCLFGYGLGLLNANDIQANLSAIAARRCVSPSHKMKLILADNLAAITVHLSCILLACLYLRFVLKVSIGQQPAYFALTLLIGSIIGITMGLFAGVIIKTKSSTKDGILAAFSLLMSFFSGLFYAKMKDVVEKNVPLLNRLNPAALITDCFYCLTVYNDTTKYFSSLFILIVIAVVLTCISFFIIRRVRYESI